MTEIQIITNDNPGTDITLWSTGLPAPYPADQHPALVYVAGLQSRQSQRVMQSALRTIASLIANTDAPDAALRLPWGDLRYPHVAAVRARLLDAVAAGRYKPDTANRYLAALRGVMRESWRLGYLSAEQYQRIADVGRIRATREPAGRDVAVHELRRLLLDCLDEESIIGTRDAAIIGVLATTGLRRAELVSGRCEPATGEIVVVGKGNKERVVYVAGKAERLLNDWLLVRGVDSRDLRRAGFTVQPIFTSVRKNGALGDRLTAQAVYNMLRARVTRLGLERITPHDLRRTFVGDMLEAGVDPSLIARFTGHASMDMVGRYDRRPRRAQREAAQKVDLPL